MRITRELLLKIARETAAQRARADHGIICVYLSGSLRRDDPLLGGTADIDLFVIHTGEPFASREIVRMSDEVHLDIAHLPEVTFRQPRHLRTDAWVGSFLCADPLVLHDLQHWFEFIQASAAAQFYLPENVMERANPLAESARQGWMSLISSNAEHGPERIWAYLKVLESAANAIALLSGVPLTERRFMLQLEQRAQAISRPGLAAGLSDLLGVGAANEDIWKNWVKGWEDAYQAAAKTPELLPTQINPHRRFYYQRAFEALHHDAPNAALWPLLRTWTRAIRVLPPESAQRLAWNDLLVELELDEPHFAERLSALDTYLDSMEETLEVWGKNNGV